DRLDHLGTPGHLGHTPGIAPEPSLYAPAAGLPRRLQPTLPCRTPFSHGEVPPAARPSGGQRPGPRRRTAAPRTLPAGDPRTGPLPGLRRALPERRTGCRRAAPPRPAVERSPGAAHGARGGRLAAGRRAGPGARPGL